MKKRIRILWIGVVIIFQSTAIFAMSSNQIGEFHIGYRLVESNGYGSGGSGYLTSLNSVFTNYQLKDNYTIFWQA
ncbi:MAG: hypothetical protein NTX05_01920, partial [Fusobacteria bacterium]|nr:hypothetical protein [Fusobacteriota bacterium]